MNPWKKEQRLNEIGEAGVWVEYEDGMEVRLGSTETPLYKKVFGTVYDRVRAKYKNRNIPDDVAEKAFNEVYATAIVFEWRGPNWLDENDKPLAFSLDAVLKALVDLPRFRAFCVAFANERMNFASAIEEDATKNSSTVSSGGSTGVTA